MVASGVAHICPRLGDTFEWNTCAAHALVLCAGGKIVQAPSTGMKKSGSTNGLKRSTSWAELQVRVVGAGASVPRAGPSHKSTYRLDHMVLPLHTELASYARPSPPQQRSVSDGLGTVGEAVSSTVSSGGAGLKKKEAPELVYNKERWHNPHFVAYGKVAKKKGKMWASMMGSSSKAAEGQAGAGAFGAAGAAGGKKEGKGGKKRKLVLVNGKLVPAPEPALDARTAVLAVLIAILVALVGAAAMKA